MGNLPQKLLEENAYLQGKFDAYEITTKDLRKKLEKRTSQLLFLVEAYAENISCKNCICKNVCNAEDMLDADPLVCGSIITEWLENNKKEN